MICAHFDYISGRASKAHKFRGRIHLQFNSFRGVAQLVARVLWEHDAAGSSPVTPTNKQEGTLMGVFLF